MTLIVRCIFWFGLYVFLVTFPLLVARVRAAASAFGQDALLQFHRGMGIAAVVLLLLHPVLLVASGAYPLAILGLGSAVPWAIRLGSIAALCALVVVATSLLRKRLRTPYEAWQVVLTWVEYRRDRRVLAISGWTFPGGIPTMIGVSGGLGGAGRGELEC